jgi:hypothetical protein
MLSPTTPLLAQQVIRDASVLSPATSPQGSRCTIVNGRTAAPATGAVIVLRLCPACSVARAGLAGFARGLDREAEARLAFWPAAWSRSTAMDVEVSDWIFGPVLFIRFSISEFLIHLNISKILLNFQNS